jgi:hypothetical protein
VSQSKLRSTFLLLLLYVVRDLACFCEMALVDIQFRRTDGWVIGWVRKISHEHQCLVEPKALSRQNQEEIFLFGLLM